MCGGRPGLLDSTWSSPTCFERLVAVWGALLMMHSSWSSVAAATGSPESMLGRGSSIPKDTLRGRALYSKLSGSSHSWVHRHIKDPYVKASSRDQLRSRAAYKLKEIQEKYKLIKSGSSVVDLGATPGGWSQVAVPLVGKRGRVVAVDLLDMAPIAGVTFMIGDFTQPSVQARLLTALEAGGADIILSDMAPAFLGDRETDHLRSIGLSMQVFDFADEHLKRDGSVLCKFFKGRDESLLVARAKSGFQQVKLIKPKASRPESAEMYILARGRKSILPSTE